jgi:hypothetical protein
VHLDETPCTEGKNIEHRSRSSSRGADERALAAGHPLSARAAAGVPDRRPAGRALAPRTLEATIAWSYDLLAPEEQRLWPRPADEAGVTWIYPS